MMRPTTEGEAMRASTIFQRSQALNYAYLDHIGNIMGRSSESRFGGNPDIAALGENVSEILENDGIADEELVNRVAGAVEMRDWFISVGFEDVPTSYYVDRRRGG